MASDSNMTAQTHHTQAASVTLHGYPVYFRPRDTVMTTTEIVRHRLLQLPDKIVAGVSAANLPFAAIEFVSLAAAAQAQVWLDGLVWGELRFQACLAAGEHQTATTERPHFLPLRIVTAKYNRWLETLPRLVHANALILSVSLVFVSCQFE